MESPFGRLQGAIGVLFRTRGAVAIACLKGARPDHVLVAGAVFIVVWLPGCGKILGVDDYRVAPKSNADAKAPIQFSAPACDSCVAKQCGAEHRDCESDPACHDQATCFYGTCKGDNKNSCAYDCYSKSWPSPSGAMKKLSSCALDRCNTFCGSCATPFVGQTQTCGDCAEGDNQPGGLCEWSNACMEGIEDAHSTPGVAQCRGFLACLTAECDELGESDPKCRMACGGKFPEGARYFYTAVGPRYLSGCAGKCNGGNHWRCQQPPAWPPVLSTDAHLTLRLTESAGVPVRACRAGDYRCTAPLAATPTDAATDVLFIVPPGPPQLLVQQQVFFDIQDPAAPLLFAPQQPVVGNQVLWWVPSPFWTNPAGLTDAATARGDLPVDLVRYGVVEVVVADCDGAAADYVTPASPGTAITTTTSSVSTAYYGLPPTPTATHGGLAWFINVPAPSTTVDVRLDGKPLQTATVPVRAGTTTVVTFNYPQWL